MRVFAVVLVVLMMFSGCSTAANLETVADVYDVSVSSPVQNVAITLPEGAAEAVLASDNGDSYYVCDGFTVAVSTLAGGDLARTIREITGFEKTTLTVMTTRENGTKRHTCAWTSLGEASEQICKAVILDDGNSHYAVTVMCDYEVAGELAQEMNNVLDSVTLHVA
ncbi:MAG: hypothetical protein IKU07_08545 [Oscillospiraceae bacterium]|nr:hypothetical protein [Oscillospiraceae bacterium]